MLRFGIPDGGRGLLLETTSNLPGAWRKPTFVTPPYIFGIYSGSEQEFDRRQAERGFGKIGPPALPGNKRRGNTQKEPVVVSAGGSPKISGNGPGSAGAWSFKPLPLGRALKFLGRQ